jgi:hypothetical protein
MKQQIGCRFRGCVAHELNARSELLLQRSVPLQYRLFVTRRQEEIATLPELHVVAQESAGFSAAFDEFGTEKRHLGGGRALEMRAGVDAVFVKGLTWMFSRLLNCCLMLLTLRAELAREYLRRNGAINYNNRL